MKLHQDGTEVSLGNERIVAVNYPAYEDLFAEFSAMHLLAPEMPARVESDFRISKPMIEYIGEMYQWHGHKPPKVTAPSTKNPEIGEKGGDRAVVAYSAGKDSMWNLWRAQEKYGRDNVLAVHIYGLNTSNSSQERIFSKRQSEAIGFPLEILQIVNSSGGEGYNVMVSRDAFMTGILVPYALRFGASHIITEGFAEMGEREPFTGDERNMAKFNRTLERMGLPVQVDWENKPEMDIVKDLYQNVPGWMPHVCNCFSPDYAKPGIRRSWNGGRDKKGHVSKARTPTFVMYDSQCGSCVKCQIINLGRILYEPEFKASDEDVRTWLKVTDQWHKQRGESHRDMITPSYVRDMRTAGDRYGLKLRYI